MRAFVLSFATTAALLTAACVDEPTRPDVDTQSLDPELAVYEARSRGTIELPPLPGATDVGIQGVNSSGQAVGNSGGQAALWELTGSPSAPVTVRALPQLVGALEIDDSGRVLGHRDDRAAILENGVVTLIDPLPGHAMTGPGGMSNGGHVVGSSWIGDVQETSRGFRWIDGRITALPPLPGNESSQALAVNSSGVAAGVSYDAQTELTTIVVWKNAWPVSTGFRMPGNLMLGINDAGFVLISSDDGDRVVLWRGGIARRLPPPDGDNLHWGWDVSPGGIVLGQVESDDGPDRWGVWRGSDFFSVGVSPLSSCWRVSDGGHVVCDSPERDYPFYAFVGERLGSRAVTDLTPTSATTTSVTLTWTQVRDDGGNPARYRVKYSRPPISWGSATIGCNVRGTAVGQPVSCTIGGLDPSTSYDFQLMSYRQRADGTWAGAVYSNIGVGQTE